MMRSLSDATAPNAGGAGGLQLVGTLLPTDSMRWIKGRNSKQLLAAAGLDLFRHGLTCDDMGPMRMESRHPAVKPNLNSIPETDSNTGDDEDVAIDETQTQSPSYFPPPSQVILIIGGTLISSSKGDHAVMVTKRLEKALQLYWDVMQISTIQQSHNSPGLCYLAPTGGDSSEDDGVNECETIRNALVRAGVSPHHILMNCTTADTIMNIYQLLPMLRHLQIENVHVVTSAFHVPRAQMVVERMLRAVPDMQFRTTYHGAPDTLGDEERAKQSVLERSLMEKLQQPLEAAVRELQTQRRSSIKRWRNTSSPDLGQTETAQ